MGVTEVSVRVVGDGDRAALHADLWRAARELIGAYTLASCYDEARAYLAAHVLPHAGGAGWGVEGDRLRWSFPDPGNRYRRSASAWAHWLRLALAADRDRFAELAREHGLELAGGLPELAELLAEDGRFVYLRDTFWIATPDALHGDDEWFPATALHAGERDRLDEACHRCACGMCRLLRPEPQLLAQVRDGRGDVEAAWYLARAATVSADALVDIVLAGQGDMSPLVPAVERYAPRVPDAWPTLTALLPRLRGGALGLALYALASIATDGARRAALVEALRPVLAGRDAAAQAAAEVAGRVGHGVPGLPEQLARLLDEELPDELRHHAVLGLVNLCVPYEQEVSEYVRERLAREAAGDGEASGLASWLLGWRLPPEAPPDGGPAGGRPPAGGPRLTDSAAATIRRLLDQEGRPDLRVRAEVQSPDTATPHYQLFLDHESRDDDVVTQFDTDAGVVELVVDAVSAPHLDGFVIDFLDEPGRQGFLFDRSG
jgi:Fe-S cluster assembly iron-binding protein IscA